MLRIETLVLGMVQTNVYIVINEETKECLIIDPADRADVIIHKVTQLQAKPVAILLTHGHYDHILAAQEVRDHFGIPVMALDAEEKLLSDPSWNLSGDMFYRGISLKADRYLHEGEDLDLIGRTIRVLHTPGHTGGGACYYLESEKILFSGDTLFQMSVGRTDFPTGNMKTLIDSVTSKLMILPDDTVVYPGHGDATTIGFERDNNYFL